MIYILNMLYLCKLYFNKVKINRLMEKISECPVHGNSKHCFLKTCFIYMRTQAYT